VKGWGDLAREGGKIILLAPSFEKPETAAENWNELENYFRGFRVKKAHAELGPR
jgi:hypothetical protein